MVASLARRIPVALLLALLLGGGATASLAASGVGALDESFVLPLAQPGDKGAYNVHLSGTWGGDNPEARSDWTALEFAWGTADGVLDGNGSAGPAVTLSVLVRSWDHNLFSDAHPWTLGERASVYAIRPGRQDPFLATARRESAAFEDPTQVVGLALPGREFGGHSTYRSQDFDAVRHCLLQPAWAGQSLPLHGPLPSGSGCTADLGDSYAPTPRPDYLFSPGWEAAGREEVNGIPALRLERGGERMWVSPAFPVPLRYAVTEAPLGPVRTATYDLVRFTPGARAPLPGGTLGPARAPLGAAPVHPWGLDESDWRLPYTAEAAYTEAQANATVQRFLADHPDAFLLAALGVRADLYGFVERSWTFHLTNGTATLRVDSSERVPAQADGLPEALRSRFATRAVTAQPEEAPFLGVRPALPRPATFPSAGMVLQRWREAGGQGEPTSWAFGYRLSLTTFRWEPVAAAGVLSVHHRIADPAIVGPQAPDALGSLNFTMDLASMRADGSLVTHDVSVFDTASPSALLPEGPAPSVAPASGARTGLAWLPAVQAGGLLGLLAALGYLLWPLLRSAGTGLFSRIETPALLENPTRRAIVEAVQRAPGIHFNALQRATGLPNGVLVHHLGKLARGGLLVAERAGRFTCYRLPGQASPAGLAVLKPAGARRVLEEVRAAPGLPVREVAERAGLAPSTAHYHLDRLAAAGLVVRHGDGRDVRFLPASAA